MVPQETAMRSTSPSGWAMNPVSAPQRFVAFSTSVSSTGLRSNVERLIALSTSLVAVADLIAHGTNQPDFFGNELARLFANAVDRSQKLFFRFDRKNREKTVV